MNMIVCDQQCQHQREGYCGLNQMTSLTAETGAKCGYYEAPRQELKLPGKLDGSLPENRKRL